MIFNIKSFNIYHLIINTKFGYKKKVYCFFYFRNFCCSLNVHHLEKKVANTKEKKNLIHHNKKKKKHDKMQEMK